MHSLVSEKGGEDYLSRLFSEFNPDIDRAKIENVYKSKLKALKKVQGVMKILCRCLLIKKRRVN